MDRSTIYSQEQARTFDVLNGWKDSLKAIGNAVQAVLGNNSTYVSGFSASQQGSPNLTINLAAGQIYQFGNTDTATWGALGTDTNQILQQGVVVAQVLSFTTAALTAGQAQWVLVSAAFQQTDAVRSGDPTSGILPYYNSANPPVPLQGPGNNGATQNTVRKGVAQVNITYGSPATAGSHTVPATPANNVPMYLIQLTFGQTSITNGQINVSASTVAAGATQAPFLAGILGAHHGGISGQSTKIQLGNAAEVQGILPIANSSGTSAYTDHNAALANIRRGTGSPQGVLAGTQSDLYLATDTGVLYACTVTGVTAGASTWVATGGAGGGGTVTSVDAALTNLPFLSKSGVPITGAGTLTLAASGATGDLPYFSALNTMAKLTVGSNGQILTVSSGSLAWSNGSASKPVTLVSSFPYTIASNYGTYLFDAPSGADVVVNMPSTATGVEITAKRLDVNINKIVVTPVSPQTIEQDIAGTYAATYPIIGQGPAFTWAGNNANTKWYRL